PLAEEITPENAGDLPGDWRNDDLKSLEGDEDEGGQDSPGAQRLLQEVLVAVQANQELIGRSVGNDEPDAIADDERGDAPREATTVSEDQLVALCPGQRVPYDTDRPLSAHGLSKDFGSGRGSALGARGPVALTRHRPPPAHAGQWTNPCALASSAHSN